jgi:hypothetical protein
MTIRADAGDDQGITAVEFLVNGIVRRRLAAPPFEMVWPDGGVASRPAYLYARAIDGAGNVAYSGVLRLPAPSR